MAIWQFKLNLIPANTLLNVEGYIPPYLEAYAKVDVDSFDENKAYPNYWVNYNPKKYAAKFEEILGPKQESWGDGIIVGNRHSSNIQLWEEDFSVALDIRDFNRTLLHHIINFAKKENLYIVAGRQGRVFPPSYDEVISEIEKSTALKFCLDPEKTLLSISVANN